MFARSSTSVCGGSLGSAHRAVYVPSRQYFQETLPTPACQWCQLLSLRTQRVMCEGRSALRVDERCCCRWLVFQCVCGREIRFRHTWHAHEQPCNALLCGSLGGLGSCGAGSKKPVKTSDPKAARKVSLPVRAPDTRHCQLFVLFGGRIKSLIAFSFWPDEIRRSVGGLWKSKMDDKAFFLSCQRPHGKMSHEGSPPDREAAQEGSWHNRKVHCMFIV